MDQTLIFALGSLIGGFALGFIFLAYFDNITESHVYIAVIAAAAFIVNLLVISTLNGQNVLTAQALGGSALAVIQFAIFLTAAYFGRRLRLGPQHRIIEKTKALNK